MQNMLLSQAATPEGSGGLMEMLGGFWPIIMIVVVFYFFMIRPQNKRAKQAQQMRDSLEVGDEVITNGGIIGRVVSVRDDSLVIESGADNNRIRIAKWAIQANNTARSKTTAQIEKDIEKSNSKKDKDKEKEKE